MRCAFSAVQIFFVQVSGTLLHCLQLQIPSPGCRRCEEDGVASGHVRARHGYFLCPVPATLQNSVFVK